RSRWALNRRSPGRACRDDEFTGRYGSRGTGNGLDESQKKQSARICCRDEIPSGRVDEHIRIHQHCRGRLRENGHAEVSLGRLGETLESYSVGIEPILTGISLRPLRTGKSYNSFIEQPKKIASETFIGSSRIIRQTSIEIAWKSPDDFTIDLSLDYLSEKLHRKIRDLRWQGLARSRILLRHRARIVRASARDVKGITRHVICPFRF